MKWRRHPEGGSPVRSLDNEEMLDEALDVRCGVLFKHSPVCMASAFALRQVRKFAVGRPDVPVSMIDVVAERALSAEAARRLGVQHESPQAIAFMDGSVVWFGSQREITADALTAAVGMTEGRRVT